MTNGCGHCDEITRRRLLSYGVGGFLGFAAARQTELFGAPRLDMLLPQDTTTAKAQACIVLWLAGGPSHIDTWDPKEGRDTGGPVKGVDTNVSGIKISEYLSQTARVMDKIAVVRSMTSREGSHERGRYLLHTGYVPGPVVHPAIGSIVAMEVGDSSAELPNFMSIGNPTEGSGFLPPEYSPLVVNNPGGPIPNVSYPGEVSAERFRERMKLLEEQEKEFAREHSCEETEKHKTAYEKADKLMHTPRLKAFDLSGEKTELVKAYGDNRFGKGCLLARRLVQSGVKFVEVSQGGWDTHQDNFTRTSQLCQTLDPAVATLIRDLHDRRLLESTLVVVMGEFGRTPRINKDNGRDHYPRAWSLMLAGGGIQGGRVIGSTDKDGVEIKERAVTVPDLMATLYTCLGVDFNKKLPTPLGNRFVLVDNGKPVKELLS